MVTQSDPFGDALFKDDDKQEEEQLLEESSPQADEALAGNKEHSAANNNCNRVSPAQDDDRCPNRQSFASPPLATETVGSVLNTKACSAEDLASHIKQGFKMLTKPVDSLVNKTKKWQHPHAFWIFAKTKKLMVTHSITKMTPTETAPRGDFDESDDKDNEQDHINSSTMAIFSGQPVDHMTPLGFLQVEAKELFKVHQKVKVTAAPLSNNRLSDPSNEEGANLTTLAPIPPPWVQT